MVKRCKSRRRGSKPREETFGFDCGGEFWEVKTGDRDSHMGIIIIDVAFLVLDDIINGDVFR